MVFSFTIESGLYPGKVNKDKKTNGSKNDSNDEESGKVYLTYSDYKVNIGLPDSIFKDEDGRK